MKLNKYLTIFIGLFVSLNTILFVVLQKYYLLLLHHTIFYCQEMVKTLSIRLPNNTGIAVFSFLTLILLVAAFKLFITAIKIVRLKKDLTENIIESVLVTSLLKKLRLTSRVTVVYSEMPFAFCFGVRQPKIYLSTKLIKILSVPELKVVLLHEKYHLEHRDTLTLMLATIFESLLPFFPLLTDFIRQYRVERELAADEAASQGTEGVKHLSMALIKLLKFDIEPTYVAVPAIADPDTLETRIKQLANKPHSSTQFRFKNVVISLSSVVFLLILAITPVHAFELHSEDHDVMMFCTQGQSCESACRATGNKVLQSSAVLYSPVTTPR